MRFTLFKLFLAVALLGLAFAGMTARTSHWAYAIVSLTVAMYAITAIRSVALSGAARVAAIAFAAVGGCYLFLAICFAPMRDLLVTDHVLVALGKYLRADPPLIFYRTPGAGVNGRDLETQRLATHDELSGAVALPPGAVYLQSSWWAMGFGDNNRINPDRPAGTFLLIGHCVWSWVFAVLAGWGAGWMYAKRGAYNQF